MSIYVITGVSSGIGFQLLKQISDNPKDTVIGLVRGKEATEKKVATELGDRPNVHILHGDLTKYESLKQAVADTAKIVGDRGIDYLVANAGFPSQFDAYDPVSVIGEKPQELDEVAAKSFNTNVIGNIHLLNLFVPLVKQGKIKKVIAISSGHGDLDLINDLEIEVSTLYAATKAALNVVVAKFAAQYKKEGILFLSMSPGILDVGAFDDLTPQQIEGLSGFMKKMVEYAPHFKGPTPVADGIPQIRETWEKASIETGFSGAFISQFGNKQWV